MTEIFDQFDFDSTADLGASILRDVTTYVDPSLPNCVALVKFSFGAADVFVGIEIDEDTLACSREMHGEYRHCLILTSPFWAPFVGRHLMNAWQMRNEKGRIDAYQLRFREKASEGQYSIVQLYAEASQITISEMALKSTLRLGSEA